MKVEQLTKTYVKKSRNGAKPELFHAIQDISFEIEPGEIFGIVGLSGSGKTTLLRCILQLTRPDEGAVLYNGSNLVNYSAEELRTKVRPRIRKVYQHPEAALNPGLMVEKILSQPIELYRPGITNAEKKAETDRLLGRVGLPLLYKTKYPYQLSGGEKRRVALARALATNPEILFADEPFAGLDKALQYRMLKLLMDIKQERNLTIVMVSHDIDVIRHVCDRILTLKGGKAVDTAVAGTNGVDVNMDYFM